jgi:hypothetical protein
VQAVTTYAVRAMRAVKALARDGRIPRPLRGLAALGLLSVPRPFDEAILLLVAILLFAFYRGSLHDAWSGIEGKRFADQKTAPS